ncbi:MAG: ABC transporter permease [Ornithinimicrobium sp.]|uniref:ABC transporter permease n=1 Tax=Ornithinimicrobium sp. TaxID=1977084 RepID=UPI0026E04BCE|nr:ABC transporter permease [Ornithinimicrobium sp.]MDO5739274.1 ABC transporter permease [Ornithinimicrobium sp.]
MSTTQQTLARAPEAAPLTQAPRKTSAKWPLVAAREIQVRLRDKNFLMGTGLSLVILLGVLIAQSFLGGGSLSYQLGVEGSAGTQIVTAVDQAAKAGDPEAKVTSVELGDAAAVEAAARNGDVDYGLIATADGWELVDEGPTNPELQMLVGQVVSEQSLAANAEAAGTDLPTLMQGSSLTARDLTAKADGSDGFLAFILGFVFAMLFYMASLLFGMQIASSVVEEKQSRLVEILAAAIPVRQLLLGKVLGNTLLALVQLVLIVAVGLIGLTFTEYDVALPGLAAGIAWYIPFFVLGFLALACIWAAAGALASRVEDLQSTTMPLTMLLVLAFIVGINLQGTARDIASFVPIMSTILMPMRILEGKAEWWEPIVALLLVLGFCLLTIRLGARLYHRSLLHTSGSLSWRKALALKD